MAVMDTYGIARAALKLSNVAAAEKHFTWRHEQRNCKPAASAPLVDSQCGTPVSRGNYWKAFLTLKNDQLNG